MSGFDPTKQQYGNMPPMTDQPFYFDRSGGAPPQINKNEFSYQYPNQPHQQQQSHPKDRRDHRDHRDNRDNRDHNRDRERERSGRGGGARGRSRSRERSPGPNERDERFERYVRERQERRRKRKSGWDKAPTGFDTVQALPVIPLAVPAILGPDPHQIKQAKRLYVGNIPPHAGAEEITEFFNKAMSQAGVTKDNNPSPCVEVQLNREKNYAFIEMATTEDATAGMGFDGISFQGHALKLRRPKDYKPIDENGNSNSAPIPHIVSTNVQEGPNKIFVGGLPSYLNEDQVKELLSTFGPLKSFNLVKDSSNGTSKGFAFFEYLDPSVTDKACAGLNGMRVGEKNILVQRANVGAKAIPQPNPNAESILKNPTALYFLNLGMPIAAAAVLLGIDLNDPGEPTRILHILNPATPIELMQDDDYEDIKQDLLEECEKYGSVISIFMPRPPLMSPEQTAQLRDPLWGVGRCFVEYKRREDCFKACQALGGRRFNGHHLVTGFFPETRYYAKDFKPEENEELVAADRVRRLQEQKAQEAGELEYQETEQDREEKEREEREKRRRQF